MRRAPRLAVAALALLVAWAPGAASAHGYRLGDIAVGHVWAPPPGPGAPGVPVYGPLLNRGQATVRLVGVSTPVAEKARFRIDKDGETRWPETIALRPGKPLALAPWREHIWLTGLKRPLKDGESFHLTLDFGRAGRLTIEVPVQTAAGH